MEVTAFLCTFIFYLTSFALFSVRAYAISCVCILGRIACTPCYYRCGLLLQM